MYGNGVGRFNRKLSKGTNLHLFYPLLFSIKKQVFYSLTGFLLLAYSSSFILAPKCPDPYKYSPCSQTCVRLENQSKSWSEAKQYCESADEHLITFGTPKAAKWLIYVLQTDKGKLYFDIYSVWLVTSFFN